MQIMLVVAALAAALAVGYVLHRAAVWAEDRGWIYYRAKRRPRGLGMSLFGQIYQPSIEHVVDEEQAQRIEADQDDSGGPPVPGEAEETA